MSGLFLRLLELPDAVVMEVLGVVMAETLASGTGLIETIGLHLDIKMADYWTADSAFYHLIRDREVLTAILSEVGGDTLAQAHAAEKTKTLKSVINDCLTGAGGRPKHNHWVPRGLRRRPEVLLDAEPAAAVAVEAVKDGDSGAAEAIEDIEEQRLAA